MKGLYLLLIAIAVVTVHTVHSAVITQEDVSPAALPVRGKCPDVGRARVWHETDCNAYYDCNNGRRSPVRHCPQNTVFNPYIEACDVMGTVECPSTLL